MCVPTFWSNSRRASAMPQFADPGVPQDSSTRLPLRLGLRERCERDRLGFAQDL